MARVPNVVQTEQPIRPRSAAVRRLAVMGRACAHCGSTEIRPSNRRNALDILLACMLLAPFRCRVCRQRFYRMWRPSLIQAADPPMAPVLVMPAPRLTPKVDTVEPPPVESHVEEPKLQPVPSPGTGVVLILENDLSIRKLLGRLLERRGYRAVEIARAEDLASELANCRADLLVVGVSSAGGADVQSVVALAQAHPRLKILAVSEQSLQQHEIPGRFLSLPKPFPLDGFVDCVDRLMERSRSANNGL